MEQSKKEEIQNIFSIKKGLLIEDNLLHQKIMTHNLQQLNYQVDLIIDSTVATQRLDSQTYDLIIIDVNLYGHLLGEKLIQIVRQNKLNIGSPVIAWSAYVNEKDEKKYLKWGADAALEKRLNSEDLENAIWKCYSTPRCEREFYYKSKILQKILP